MSGGAIAARGFRTMAPGLSDSEGYHRTPRASLGLTDGSRTPRTAFGHGVRPLDLASGSRTWRAAFGLGARLSDTANCSRHRRAALGLGARAIGLGGRLRCIARGSRILMRLSDCIARICQTGAWSRTWGAAPGHRTSLWASLDGSGRVRLPGIARVSCTPARLSDDMARIGRARRAAPGLDAWLSARPSSALGHGAPHLNLWLETRRAALGLSGGSCSVGWLPLHTARIPVPLRTSLGHGAHSFAYCTHLSHMAWPLGLGGWFSSSASGSRTWRASRKHCALFRESPRCSKTRRAALGLGGRLSEAPAAPGTRAAWHRSPGIARLSNSLKLGAWLSALGVCVWLRQAARAMPSTRHVGLPRPWSIARTLGRHGAPLPNSARGSQTRCTASGSRAQVSDDIARVSGIWRTSLGHAAQFYELPREASDSAGCL